MHIDAGPGKNTDGSEGIVCNNCGGYGYTIKLGGGKLPCNDCKQSGVKELSKEELQKKVFNLEQDIMLLRRALMEDLGFQGKPIPAKVLEAKHAQ